jgi:hypothetical protein
LLVKSIPNVGERVSIRRADGACLPAGGGRSWCAFFVGGSAARLTLRCGAPGRRLGGKKVPSLASRNGETGPTQGW